MVWYGTHTTSLPRSMAEQTTAHTELALPPFKGQQRAQERLLCLCDWGHFRRGEKKSVPQQLQSITLFPFPYFQMVVDHKNTDPMYFYMYQDCSVLLCQDDVVSA